jgi:cytochrome c-type biogenesis protein CcmE
VTDIATDTSTPPTSQQSEHAGGPALPSPRRRRTRRRLLVVFVLLAGAFVFLLVEGLGSSLDYFDTVNQALTHRQQLGTTTFRLEGVVVPGSIRATTAGADFALCEGDNTVHVANTGSPPQLFQSHIPVVVVGHFASDTSTNFVSDTIMVKHSATYTAQHPGRVKPANSAAC